MARATPAVTRDEPAPVVYDWYFDDQAKGNPVRGLCVAGSPRRSWQHGVGSALSQCPPRHFRRHVRTSDGATSTRPS